MKNKSLSLLFLVSTAVAGAAFAASPTSAVTESKDPQKAMAVEKEADKIEMKKEHMAKEKKATERKMVKEKKKQKEKMMDKEKMGSDSMKQ